MHIIQFLNDSNKIQIGIVKSNEVFPLLTNRTFYELVLHAISCQISLYDEICSIPTATAIDYSELLSSSRLIPPITHRDPVHMLISGTGLTHLSSVIMRDTMLHREELSDAQKIYQSGLHGGKPDNNIIGSVPEWFFKGFGHQLKTSSQTINVPDYTIDAGEEAELVVVYIISPTGHPYRIGFALGNEFSDHGLEKQNSYYLAQSKLRECSIGPEIYLGNFPNKVHGHVSIHRQGKLLWEQYYKTGYNYMVYSIENIEHHVFKHEVFRQPGDLHILFLGADKVSFFDNIKLQSSDTVAISADLFQHPLINKVQFLDKKPHIKVKNV